MIYELGQDFRRSILRWEDCVIPCVLIKYPENFHLQALLDIFPNLHSLFGKFAYFVPIFDGCFIPIRFSVWIRPHSVHNVLQLYFRHQQSTS